MLHLNSIQIIEKSGSCWHAVGTFSDEKVHNCVGVSVDNTSVNLGKRNSILTRVLVKNPTIYFMGCPCHIVHNTCMKAAEKFNQDMHNWSQTYLDTLSVPSPVPAGHIICFFLDSPGHIMRFVQDPRGHNLCFSPDPPGHNLCFSLDPPGHNLWFELDPPWTHLFHPRLPWTPNVICPRPPRTQFGFQLKPPWTQFVIWAGPPLDTLTSVHYLPPQRN